MTRMITNTSGCTGVSLHKKSGKWQAYIHTGKKMTHLGFFDDRLRAIRARQCAERREDRICQRSSYDRETQTWIDEAESQEDRKKRQQRAKYEKHGHKYRKRIKAQYDIDSIVVLARNKKWRDAHPEKVSADKLAWERKFRAEHPEEAKARSKASYERRKDKVVAYGKKWRKENAGKNAANSAEHRAYKLHRTPPWADLEAINFFYECCPDGCDVDHVIPLQAKNISGLHVHENLQWLPTSVNRSKSNAFTSA